MYEYLIEFQIRIILRTFFRDIIVSVLIGMAGWRLNAGSLVCHAVTHIHSLLYVFFAQWIELFINFFDADHFASSRRYNILQLNFHKKKRLKLIESDFFGLQEWIWSVVGRARNYFAPQL
jgi:hypothetical protein